MAVDPETPAGYALSALPCALRLGELPQMGYHPAGISEETAMTDDFAALDKREGSKADVAASSATSFARPP